jgi:hypothetical protein
MALDGVAMSPVTSTPLSTTAFQHTKTASITGSVNSDSLHSDSSLSYPSSGGLRGKGGAEGSEADSERDSVSPQRQTDEVSNIFFYLLVGIVSRDGVSPEASDV